MNRTAPTAVRTSRPPMPPMPADGDAPPPDGDPQPEPDPEPFHLYGIDDLDDLPAVEWIVDGLVQDREGVLIYGQRGTGKSLVALDLACHVAADLPWRRRPVRGGPVVLVALENVDALPGRLRAWHAHRPDVNLDRLRFTTAKIRARSDIDEARLHATLDTLDEPPALVIIDTQARFAAGLDEKSEVDMGAVVDWLDRLRDHTGHAVALVHHAGKDPARGARGSSVLEASFTAVAQVTKSTGGVITLTADKINNGPEGWELAWALAITDPGPRLHPLHPKQPLIAKLREIRDAVDTDPGLSKRALEAALTGRAESNRSAIDDALHHGVIVNRPTGRAHAYHPGTTDPDDLTTTVSRPPSRNHPRDTVPTTASLPLDTPGHNPGEPTRTPHQPPTTTVSPGHAPRPAAPHGDATVSTCPHPKGGHAGHTPQRPPPGR